MSNALQIFIISVFRLATANVSPLKNLFYFSFITFSKGLFFLKPELRYIFNWNILVVQRNWLKHVGLYTFQLIDDICSTFFIFLLLFFSFMRNTLHSFLFSISWKVWTCLNFSVNWNQFWLVENVNFFVITIHNLLIPRSEIQLNE